MASTLTTNNLQPQQLSIGHPFLPPIAPCHAVICCSQSNSPRKQQSSSSRGPPSARSHDQQQQQQQNPLMKFAAAAAATAAAVAAEQPAQPPHPPPAATAALAALTTSAGGRATGGSSLDYNDLVALMSRCVMCLRWLPSLDLADHVVLRWPALIILAWLDLDRHCPRKVSCLSRTLYAVVTQQHLGYSGTSWRPLGCWSML